MRLYRYFALCLLMFLPSVATADDIGPEQAQALRQQLQDWLSGLLGPAVKLSDLPWQFAGAGDHYTIAWPINGADQASGGLAVTIALRQIDANHWSIDQVSVPPAAGFTVRLPTPDTKLIKGPMKFSYTIGQQDARGVIDTAFASASTFHSEVDDLGATSDSGTEHQEQHFDRYLLDMSLKPTPDGRLDLLMDADADGWKSTTKLNGGTPIAFGVQNFHGMAKVSGIHRENVADLISAVRGFVAALPSEAMSKHGAKDIPAPARAQIRLMVAALSDVVAGVSLEETLDGIHFDMAGIGTFGLKHFKIGFGGDAPDGRLHLWLDLGLAGLESPSLPPAIAAYLPRHVEIRPSLSGIPTADLQRLALDATEDDGNGNRMAGDIAAMLLHGDASAGIESLSFDLGPAQVEGTGRVTMQSPDRWHGEAHVSATGFDDLTNEARRNPDLQPALPILILLSGIARADGQRLVWDIASDGLKVTVNGLDLSQLGDNDTPRKKPNQPLNR